MMRAIGSFWLVCSVLSRCALASSTVSAVNTSVTPIQKVIQMLSDMKAQGKVEKHEEEVKFAEFQQWCDSVRAEKTKNIKSAALQIDQLTADIAKADSDAESLAEEVKILQSDIAKMEDELQSATALRNQEHSDYVAQHTDFSESIDACERAVQVLKTRTADVPQSLLQLQNSNVVPAKAKAMIESFLAMNTDAAEGVPEANAYEFQSGSVVAIIEKLRLKFQDQRMALEKEELNAKSNFEVLKQQLTVQTAGAEDSAARKTGVRAERLEDSATGKADKQSTEGAKADDEKTLSDTNTECSVRSTEFEKNQVTRAGEIEALAKATEILASGAVSGHGDTYLPSFLQLHDGSHTTLAQMRSEMNGSNDARQRVVEFLQGRAAKLGSRYLSIVAARAAEDPFAKVKKMIKDLIVKLMEQANAEADHHAYCTTELATNKQTREIKTSEVEELSATIDELTSLSAQLGGEITELSDAIAALRGEQAEATKIRGEEKTTNAKTTADAKEAQKAVEAATRVLKEFYAKASGAAMLQGAQSLGDEMAQASTAPYKGQQDETTGVFGMLEVILSDFARLESETSSSEDNAQMTYDGFMAESTESIAVKNTAQSHKENKRDQTDERNRALKKERELTQEELDAALDYYGKLKTDCIQTGLSYEDRARSREEELQSLKEALRILNQQDLD